MKAKKLLALIMASILALSTFTACSSATSSESSKEESSQETSSKEESSKEEVADTNVEGDIQLNVPGEFPLVLSDAPTISIFTAPQYESNSLFDSKDNKATAWFEDKVNINFDWTIVSKADQKAKLNLLFQSDAYEDIIFMTMWNAATQYSYGSQGYLLPLNEYLEGDDAYWWNLWKEEVYQVEGQFTEADIAALTMPDGNVYSMCQGGSSAFHSGYSYRMWIYEPWLDAVGMDIPKTTDEYYDVLTAFKNQDPNGNGQADEIPLSGSYSKGWNLNPMVYLMNSFVYYDNASKYYVDVEGDEKIHLSYMEDGFKDGIAYIAKLYNEGLLDNEYFIQDDIQVKSKTTQDTQLVGSITGGSWIAFTTAAADKEGDWTNYISLAPLEGPDGVQYARYTPAKPAAKAHITNNCETPKTAFRMLDCLYNVDVGMNVVYGAEGEYFEYLTEEDNVLAINGEAAKYRTLNYGQLAEANKSWSQISPAPGGGAGWHSYQAIGSENPSLDVETGLYNAAVEYAKCKPAEGTVPPELIFEGDDAAMVVDYATYLNSYFDEQMSTMITTNTVEEKWDDFIAGAENIGVNELLDLYNKAYEARLEAMYGE